MNEQTIQTIEFTAFMQSATTGYKALSNWDALQIAKTKYPKAKQVQNFCSEIHEAFRVLEFEQPAKQIGEILTF